ncbi:hypothetical protein IE53DRAFT_309607 [Violaceomyces palustris]|uniref:Uncharacterized protein n=1 Tax=Violaceomyces palustris TaxID=1673888 RepID=A0ACD0P6T8_9BASI|nr:hypothetical protein IE53DRAFT_309607 [Violaceomyces palustris]
MTLEPFKYDLWDPKVKVLLRAYLRSSLTTFLLTLIPIWLAMPFYWGSLYNMDSRVHNLEAWVMTSSSSVSSNSTVSDLVVRGLLSLNSLPPNQHLTWSHLVDSPFSPQEAVLNERTWMAVQISNRGERDSIEIHYNTARNQNAVTSFILPLTTSPLNDILRGHSDSEGTPLTFSHSDVRPFDSSAANATTFVGLIYVLILSFIFVLRAFMPKQWLASKLSLRSYLLLRLMAPVLYYFLVSWSFCLLSLPFKIPFSRFVSGGFLLYWSITWLAMIVMGGLMELVASLVTPPYMSFFMVSFIVVNNAVSSWPFQLLHPFFQYGYAMPFYHLRQSFITIIFNTRSHLALNIGVLVAWLALVWSGLFLHTLLERKKELRKSSPPAPQRPSPSPPPPPKPTTTQAPPSDHQALLRSEKSSLSTPSSSSEASSIHLEEPRRGAQIDLERGGA